MSNPAHRQRALGFSQSFRLSIGASLRTAYETTLISMDQAQGILDSHDLEVYGRAAKAGPAKIPIVKEGVP